MSLEKTFCLVMAWAFLPVAVYANERVLGYPVKKLEAPLLEVQGWTGKQAAFFPMFRVWKQDRVEGMPAIWYAFTMGKVQQDLSDVFANPRYKGVKTQGWHFQFDCQKQRGRVIEYRRTSESFLQGQGQSYTHKMDLPYQGEWIQFCAEGLEKDWVLKYPESLYEKSTLVMLWKEVCPCTMITRK